MIHRHDPLMRRVLRVVLCLIAWMAGLAPLLADYGVPRPYPWAGASANGRFLFKMLPAPMDEKDEHESTRREYKDHRLLAFEIREDGSLDEMWQAKGWFADECFLSDNGRYLVRMGPWAEDQDGHKDLALAFYDRGVLLKAYQVRDLLKDASKAENSASHYDWQPHIQTQQNGFLWDGAAGGNESVLSFHLVMIDKTVYRFDVATGQVLESFVDKGAKSQGEIFEEERAAETRAGEALYAASPFKEDYDAHFEVGGLYAGGGRRSGVWFEGPQWNARLKPRKKYALPCEIDATFPIGKSGQLEASITPAEMDEALQAGLAHPFVKRCMAENKSNALGLYITGDRLHADSLELQKYLAQVLPGDQSPASLRPWAELRFYDGRPAKPALLPENLGQGSRAITAAFLHIKTGQLIYADESKWPYEPVLVDAKGVRVSGP